jgi:heterodisulfide reductase subunit A-like polyferredoxin
VTRNKLPKTRAEVAHTVRKEAAGPANAPTDISASAEAASAEAARANAALEAANRRHAEMEAALAEVVAQHCKLLELGPGRAG